MTELLSLAVAYRDKLPRNPRGGTGYHVTDNQQKDAAQRCAYAEAMGRDPESCEPNRLDGEAAIQWQYGTARSNKAQDAAIFYGVTGQLVPKASARKPQLSPLERVSKAARARKRAESEFKRAILAAKGLSASEVAQAAGVSRQRVYQVQSA